MASDGRKPVSSWCFGGVHVTMLAIETVLAESGLHVVTAADKAVLDAMANVPASLVEGLKTWPRLTDAFTAELARREASR